MQVLRASVLILAVMVTVSAIAISILLSDRADINQLQQDNHILINENKTLEHQKDSINQIRQSYQDSLQQVRLERITFEVMISTIDSVLKTIPKKYEKDRNVIRNGDIDGTINILSTF